MFEARLKTASLLKRIVDALKELVTDANWDCSAGGICLQGMDSSHVSLVSLILRSEGFAPFRCDRSLTLGINIGSMAKILKCAANDDIVTLKASDNPDTMTFTFESINQERTTEFDMKLMDIDSEHPSVDGMDYQAVVEMPSGEFQRICRDLGAGVDGDSVTISFNKEGVTFSVVGKVVTGCVKLRQTGGVDETAKGAVTIILNRATTMTFSLRFLTSFTKATPLSETVVLSMTQDAPLSIEYKINDLGYIRYFLAPKIDDDAD